LRISGSFASISIEHFTGETLSLGYCYTHKITLSDISVRNLTLQASTRQLRWTGISTQLLDCRLTAAEPENRSDNAAPDTIDILNIDRDPVPGRPIEAPVRASHLIRIIDDRFATYFRLMCPTTPIAYSGEI
jgi:hypothetical protein